MKKSELVSLIKECIKEEMKKPIMGQPISSIKWGTSDQKKISEKAWAVKDTIENSFLSIHNNEQEAKNDTILKGPFSKKRGHFKVVKVDIREI